MPILGVISGDIVKSQALRGHQLEVSLERLHEVLATLRERDLVKAFDIFRGDAFQIITTKPQSICVVAVLLRLFMASAKTPVAVRQSLAIGRVENLRESVKLSSGEAFVLSGRGLDNMQSQLITLQLSNHESSAALSLTTRLLDALLSEFSKNECEVLSHYLLKSYIDAETITHADLAKVLNRSRSHITRQLNKAYYELVVEYLNYTQKSIEELIEHG
ncbi:hypothetical protein [Pseudidiomarina homiensis]|uniref:Uncharacterized protein n=1 Tax=Pseudidiomarina homiensis TaxID=364198 RepID=A0A432Y604_9GAMM|nr:hypothetical protein [Pseudidiomarina homiensis]RUO56321.1 hypothetical protein CWI70_06110 [Pseudidiomarina homiensis]